MIDLDAEVREGVSWTDNKITIGGVVLIPTPLAGRTEPVLDEAKIAGRIGAVVTALATIAAVFGLISAADVDGLVAAAVAAGGGIVAVVNLVMPVVRARVAREEVTPLALPVTNDGVPLVPATTYPSTAVDPDPFYTYSSGT